jgi:TolA-binding protein
MRGANVKSWFAFGLCLFLLGVVGCGDDPKQMFETAQFEELQNNYNHARELYEQIIQADPGSDVAKKAKERLAALQKKAQR